MLYQSFSIKYWNSEKIDNEQVKGVLPDHLGWQKQRTEFLSKMNQAKSLRNNI